jgi:maltose O-acetyltransferase
LPGMTIGDDSIIMPGTLVTADVPPCSIAMGNPARIKPRGKALDGLSSPPQNPPLK